MKSRAPIFALLAILWFAPSALVAGPVIRETGALYVEDFLEEPLRVEVVAEGPIYFDSALGRYLGQLAPRQKVEVQAFKEGIARVRGRARQGQVAGWVELGLLAPFPEGFVQGLEKAAERKKEIDALIREGEVALNMTEEEVRKSLGKPHRQSKRVDGDGEILVWEYVRYERVPRQVTRYDFLGRPYIDLVYVKEPVGERAVTFRDGLVTAVDETEGSLTRQWRERIVVEPLELVW